MADFKRCTILKMETTESTAARFYSPVAACWCFAHNFRQLGQPGVAQKWLIWGSGGSFVALLVLCMFSFSQRLPHYIIPIAYSIAFREVAKRVHAEAVANHISVGGRLASWWVVVGISLLFLIGVFVLLFVILHLFT